MNGWTDRPEGWNSYLDIRDHTLTSKTLAFKSFCHNIFMASFPKSRLIFWLGLPIYWLHNVTNVAQQTKCCRNISQDLYLKFFVSFYLFLISCIISKQTNSHTVSIYSLIFQPFVPYRWYFNPTMWKYVFHSLADF